MLSIAIFGTLAFARKNPEIVFFIYSSNVVNISTLSIFQLLCMLKKHLSVLIREISCHKSVDPESVIFIQFTKQAARKRSRIGIEISVGEPKSCDGQSSWFSASFSNSPLNVR